MPRRSRNLGQAAIFFSAVIYFFGWTTDKNFDPLLVGCFFFEFLGESDNFVAFEHGHLSENSDKWVRTREVTSVLIRDAITTLW